MNVFNNTDFTFSAKTQNEVRNGMANAGLDEVYVSHRSSDPDNLFDLYSDDSFGNYEFSIDTNADGEAIIWNRN
jgi:hypothetical protein